VKIEKCNLQIGSGGAALLDERWLALAARVANLVGCAAEFRGPR
jgi:hypothetical protein